MCSECGKQYCPDGCPNAPTDDIPCCRLCGEPLNTDEGYSDRFGNCYCESCIGYSETDEILRICGYNSIAELMMDTGGLNLRCEKKTNKCSDYRNKMKKDGEKWKK